MIISISAESQARETRVAATPTTVPTAASTSAPVSTLSPAGSPAT
jgi:hypothetical protein